jgi:two-component system sensor histidine kinase CreC
VNVLLGLAALGDAAFFAFLARRILRSRARGVSLRHRLFYALAGAMLLGALVTGLYATAVDAETLGFTDRFTRVAPKGFLVASALLPVLAAAAAWVGGRLARPVEELSEAAARIAEGEPTRTVRSGQGAEAQKLARALTSMRREIEDKPYAAAFLRDAWHDLKTPVAAIVATLEVLEDGALDDADRAPAHRFLANLRRSAEQLDRCLQDLVTLARFETSALARAESVDLARVARDVLRSLGTLADARKVTLALASEPTDERVPLRCDEAALSRALTNLVENAITASPGGSVRLRAWGDAHELTCVEVTNEPAAIADTLKPRLFERAASVTSGGSGLGLAIARAAVEAHGGRIRLTEHGPPRVTVRIELPR